MPSLPFTFDDLRNARPLDTQRVAKESEAEMDFHNPVSRAQSFLKGRLGKIKEGMSTTDGVIDAGLAINPVLRYTDMASKFFGGPGVAKGFQDGVIQPVGDERSGQSEIVLPPMPF